MAQPRNFETGSPVSHWWDLHRDESHEPPRLTHDRDAIYRTVLANQRTFLAYIRTALTLFVAGVSFIKFFESALIEVVGWAFIPLGVATFVVGLLRYNILRRRMMRRGEPDEKRSVKDDR